MEKKEEEVELWEVIYELGHDPGHNRTMYMYLDTALYPVPMDSLDPYYETGVRYRLQQAYPKEKEFKIKNIRHVSDQCVQLH